MRNCWIGLPLLGAILATPALAEGNLAKRAERLEPLELDAAKGFSVREYQLETGKYYRWRIVSDGRDAYEIEVEGLFENAWIDKVVVEGMAMSVSGLGELEMEDEGEVDVWFIPIRPGEYEFAVENLGEQGFSGVFKVR